VAVSKPGSYSLRKAALDDRIRKQHLLEQLESQDFAEMGYEARIRHQKRIDVLKAELDALKAAEKPAETVGLGESSD